MTDDCAFFSSVLFSFWEITGFFSVGLLARWVDGEVQGMRGIDELFYSTLIGANKIIFLNSLVL